MESYTSILLSRSIFPSPSSQRKPGCFVIHPPARNGKRGRDLLSHPQLQQTGGWSRSHHPEAIYFWLADDRRARKRGT